MKNENIIRKISNCVMSFFKKNGITRKLLGLYYQVIHYCIIVLCGFLIAFCNDPFYLIILLIVISLDAFSVVILHNCPLTILEQKYLKTSLVKERTKTIKKAQIMYKCNHNYEKQLELLTNVWSLVACKILIIMVMKTINKNIIFQQSN